MATLCHLNHILVTKYNFIMTPDDSVLSSTTDTRYCATHSSSACGLNIFAKAAFDRSKPPRIETEAIKTRRVSYTSYARSLLSFSIPCAVYCIFTSSPIFVSKPVPLISSKVPICLSPSKRSIGYPGIVLCKCLRVRLRFTTWTAFLGRMSNRATSAVVGAKPAFPRSFLRSLISTS